MTVPGYQICFIKRSERVPKTSNIGALLDCPAVNSSWPFCIDILLYMQDALEHIVVGVYLSMKNVDVENVLINLIRMFQRHIYIFDECRTMVREKYPGDNLLAPQSTRSEKARSVG